MQSLIHIKGEERYAAEYLHHGCASIETSVVEALRIYLCHFILLCLK